ncbi:cardioacceleratory peptide receptor-like [Octopus vulgaris]|uniref:Cardioacceleratory peptide receptor-like n=1 Tax=Octopus vulgaris TaxID=6645 RepID=A0AA36FKC7_OCTVU|nr:cardioacceleratory peptide receptor-like [Octopus vulgaris]
MSDITNQSLLADAATQPADPSSIVRFHNTSSSSSSLDVFNFYKVEQLTFLWLLFASIVFGNITVLAAIYFTKTNRRNRMNFFIMHLALADLMSGLISVLMDAIWKLIIHWYAGNVMCKVARFLQATVTFGSTYVLVALSLDRLDAVAWPLHFTKSPYHGKILVSLAWFFSILFSIPMFFITKEVMEDDGINKQCWIDFTEDWQWQLYMTLVSVALFIIPAAIIIICYAIIIHIIWSQGKKITADECTENVKKSGSNRSQTKISMNIANHCSRSLIPQAKIRTVKMTFIIVLVFIVCWSPYMIFDLLQVYGYFQPTQRTIAISTFFNSLAPLNSAANPIIYGIFSTRICQNLRNIPCLSKHFGERDSRHTRYGVTSTGNSTAVPLQIQPSQSRPQYSACSRLNAKQPAQILYNSTNSKGVTTVSPKSHSILMKTMVVHLDDAS